MKVRSRGNAMSIKFLELEDDRKHLTRKYSQKEKEEWKMNVINYDPEADVLVVKLRDGKLVDEKLLDNDIMLGVNEEN